MPRKGQKATEEQRKRYSEAAKRKWQDPAFRQNIVDKLTGHEVSEETRQKISEGHLGKTLSDEHKEILSQRAKELWQDDEYRNRVTERINDPDVRARIFTQESSAKKSDAKRRFWQGKTAEQRRVITENWSKAGTTGTRRMPAEKVAARLKKVRLAYYKHVGPSSLEVTVAKVLDALGIHYLTEYQIHPYFADFFVPDRNLIIECDGTYWHTRPGMKERDQKRDEWLESQGYKVVRLSEEVIKHNADRAVRSILRIQAR